MTSKIIRKLVGGGDDTCMPLKQKLILLLKRIITNNITITTNSINKPLTIKKIEQITTPSSSNPSLMITIAIPRRNSNRTIKSLTDQNPKNNYLNRIGMTKDQYDDQHFFSGGFRLNLSTFFPMMDMFINIKILLVLVYETL